MYQFLKLTLLALIFASCQNEATKEPLYQDPSQPINVRVDDLLSRMTLEEKVAQMCQYVGPEHMKAAEKNLSKEDMEKSDAHGFYPGLHSSDVEKLTEQGLIGSFLHVLDVNEANHLQKLAQKSRLKIPLLIGIDAIHGTGLVRGATIYPTSIGLASTWDTLLVRKLSKETSLEMRASGAQWTFTPNVDVARDPRWGRVGETFGEDPFLVAKMGVAMIDGFQEPKANGQFNVIACAKHLIAGSDPINGLNGSPMDVSERTLREVYLPPYKAAIEAGCFTIMAAHNELNGVPCHADKWMMNDIVRDEFGFDGFIVSDWMDIERLQSKHHIAKDHKEASFLTVDAGMDMHMHGPKFLDYIVELVKEGKLSEERINKSAGRILEAKFRVGLFENPIVNVEESSLFSKKHQETALEAARKSIVLLKNDNLLPLDQKKYRRIFVTGPNANNQTILGDWAHEQPEEHVVSVLEGLQQVAPNSKIDYLDVGWNPRNIKETDVKKAAAQAKKADLAVVVVGENSFRWEWDQKTCGENAARPSIDLVGLQQQLVEAVHNSGTPTIVVLVNGRPLGVEWIAENVQALVEAWEPGSFGGQAVAEILFGKVNPSGKLPISIARSAGHGQTVYNHKPTHFFHKYVTGKTGALYPFGFGLSYTSFDYKDIKISKSEISSGESLKVSVTVSNTGKVAGDEVVQLYIRDKVSSVTRPVKELKGFRRVSLAPGESKEITFDILPEHLEFYNLQMKKIVEPGEFEVMVGSSSSDEDLLKGVFVVR